MRNYTASGRAGARWSTTGRTAASSTTRCRTCAGCPAPGSFRIPKDIFAALGDGDLKLGGFIVHRMFGIEDDPDDPTIIHPDAVRIIGHGNLNAGRRVLEKFVARVRRQGAPQHIEQPDGTSP
jgi:hypothetical protein